MHFHKYEFKKLNVNVDYSNTAFIYINSEITDTLDVQRIIYNSILILDILYVTY
jgi:hypothetical protein